LLLLLPVDFFSPAWLLRLLLLPRLALARSPCDLLLWLLALPPLLAASERLMLPDDDLELRDAIEMLLAGSLLRAMRMRRRSVTLGARLSVSVGCVCACV
jgi:hypothetical protein